MRRVLSSLLVAAVCAGCASVQRTADRGTEILGEALLPTSEEVKLGNQLAAQVNQEEKILDDDQVQRYVNQVGQRLVKAAGKSARPGITYRFTVIDEPRQVNAFALPGGHIYVYSGLIAAADNEAELAAVLGHEIGHVAERHAARALGAQFGLQTLASLALGENPGMIEQIAAGIAAQGYLARHSRDAERESDSRGLQYLIAAGYDPDAMPAFFRKLQRMGGGDPGALQQFFASHPAPGERADTIAAAIRKRGNPKGRTEIVGDFDRIRSRLGARSGGSSSRPRTQKQAPSTGTPQPPPPK